MNNKDLSARIIHFASVLNFLPEIQPEFNLPECCEAVD